MQGFDDGLIWRAEIAHIFLIILKQNKSLIELFLLHEV